MALLFGMRWRNERVGAMFEHLGEYDLGETIFRFLEVAENHVTPPSSHHTDGVWVHPNHEDIHASPAQRDCALMSGSVKPIDKFLIGRRL